MLFMGSIITSCIDNTEPQGVLEVREAYARYLDGLTSAQKANEAIAAADAAFRNAQAAVKLAIAREKEADAKAKEIANAVAQAKADKDIDYWKQQQELQKLAYERAVLEAKAALAEAQKNFDDAMRALDIYKLGLSSEEQQALLYIKDQYDFWAEALANWLDDYSDYLTDYKDYVIESILAQDSIAVTAEYFQEYIEEVIKVKEAELQTAEWAKDFWKEMLDNNVEDFLAEAEAFRNAREELVPAYEDVLRDSVIFVETYGFARDEAYREADSVYTRAIKEPTEAYDAAVAALKKANPKWASMVAEPADGKDGSKMWTAKGGSYSFNKKYALPDHNGLTPDMIQYYIDFYGWNDWADNVEFVSPGDPLDSVIVKISAADSAKFYTIVDTVWNGNQATMKEKGYPTGLWSAYEDFGRAYLFDLDKKGIEADAEAIKAAAAKAESKYDSLLKILKAAKDGQGIALVDAWNKKVAAAGKAVADLAKKIDAFEDYQKDIENNIFTVTDAVNGYDGAAPRVLFRYATAGARKISRSESDDKHFDLSAADPKWFDVDPSEPLSIVLAKADSAEFVKAIKEYFEAVAAINDKAVPYLKFITADNLGNFKVDSVRADKIDVAGLQMKATNAYLEGKGVHKVSAYDNKAVMDPSVAPTNASSYVDGLTNLINLYNHYVHGDAFILPFYTASDEAYSAAVSGVGDYTKYVKDFKDINAKADFTGFKKVFSTYNADDFKKYTAMSDEGKAVANWMDACEQYFGVEGFAGFGEKVFFDLNTFTDPTNVVVFKTIPTYKKDAKTGVVTLDSRGVVFTPWTSQYGFVMERLSDNLLPFGGVEAIAYAYSEPCECEEYSVVFEVINLKFLYELATNTSSLNEVWEALGDVLKQIKADMDAVDGNAKKTKDANKALADKFNEALKAYRTATGDAAKARKAAKDAADAEYEKAYKEIYLPILEEKHDIEILADYYNDMANALMGAYATLFAQPANPAAIREFLMNMYTQANNRCIKLAAALAEFERIYVEGFDDPTLDAIAEELDFVDEMLFELSWLNEYEDILYWYEYWQAAWEAAMELVDANKAF